MGMILVYLDSCIVINLVKGQESVRQKLFAQYAGRSFVPCVSGLVRIECLVDVYKRPDVELRRDYDRFFDSTRGLPIDVRACERAAEIRALTKLKLPDALHLAVAEVNENHEFWTSDNDFCSVAIPLQIKIVVTPLLGN